LKAAPGSIESVVVGKAFNTLGCPAPHAPYPLTLLLVCRPGHRPGPAPARLRRSRVGFRTAGCGRGRARHRRPCPAGR
jgi:hypothetical protein